MPNRKMRLNEIEETPWSVAYKNLEMVVYSGENFGRPMLNTFIYADGQEIEHAWRTIYYNRTRALNDLMDIYQRRLEGEVMDILRDARKSVMRFDRIEDVLLELTVSKKRVGGESWKKIIEFFDVKDI